MYRMAHSRRVSGRHCILGGFVLILSMGLGCNRQPSDPADAVVDQALPFHPDTHGLESDAARPALPEDSRSGSAIPFQVGSQSHVLPAGTLLTVQLSGSISPAKVQEGDSFTASVVAPLVVGRNTLVESGSLVTGHIESARLQTDRSPPLGYLQLTLNSISVGNRAIVVHTSSLFARATPRTSIASSQPAAIRLQKGRHLTFRLTAPVVLDDGTGANRQRLITASE
jgi:hypothetical protein